MKATQTNIVKSNSNASSVLMNSSPHVGEIVSDVMLCTSIEAQQKPRSFFDWLFRRPKQWIVTTTFEPIEPSTANTPSQAPRLPSSD